MYIGLLFTNHCNIKCSHCGPASGPKDRTRLTSDEILRIIDEAAEAAEGDRDFVISFSGGEPFLYFDELRAAVRHVKDKGAKATVVTNAYWAGSYKVTLKKLGALKQAGLQAIAVSCDGYHAEFIPFENIRHVLKAAGELALSVQIKTALFRNGERIHDILRKLEDVTEGLGLKIEENRCVPVGRAANLPEDDFIYADSLPEGKCSSIGMMVFTPNGDTFPCCMPGSHSALSMGNIKDSTFSELNSRLHSRTLYRIIHNKGPAYFLPFFEKAGLKFPSDKFVNICHVCHHVFLFVANEPCAKKVFEEAIQAYENESTESEKVREVSAMLLGKR